MKKRTQLSVNMKRLLILAFAIPAIVCGVASSVSRAPNYAFVDQQECISCGVCIEICPDVFDWNEAEKAEPKNPFSSQYLDQVDEALKSCPVSAISYLEFQ